MKKRKKVVLDFTGKKSIVDQSAKQECDLNYLLRGLNKSRIPVVPVVNEIRSLVGMDYQDMLFSIQRAHDSFLQLPSKVRARFGHRPEELINFVSDSKNYDEALELGLIKPDITTNANPSPSGNEEIKKPAKQAKKSGEASQIAEGGQSD